MNLSDLIERINAAHGSAFRLERAFELGESQQAFRIHDETGLWALKRFDDAGQFEMARQRSVAIITSRLRSAGYPVAEYRHVGHIDGTTYTVQERLSGKPLTGAFGGEGVAEILPQLLDLIDLQAGLGADLVSTWPKLLIDTVLIGAQGWCEHETMRQHSPATSSLLDTLQALVEARRSSPCRTSDLVHGDFQFTNILGHGTQVSGIVDWSFAEPGDRAFDIATLFFYTFGQPEARDLLWDRLVALAGLGPATIYLSHLILRQVEWSIRHGHDAQLVDRLLARSQQIVERISA